MVNHFIYFFSQGIFSAEFITAQTFLMTFF